MFRKSLRGYDEHEVNAFLERVANEVEDLLQENRGRQDQLSSLEIQVENYRKIEEALRNALVTAEKVARETKMNADQEVALTLKDAQVRAQRSVEAAREILGSVQRDLLEMAKQRRDYLTRFRLLVETQMKMLDIKQVEFEDEENLRRLEEIQRELFEDSFDRSPKGEHGEHPDTEEMRLADAPGPERGEEDVAPKLEARTPENA